MSEQEESAGGMSYRTMKGIATSIMSYLEGRDAKATNEIFQKNKEYYVASADKIIARFELAKTRIENMDIPKKDKPLLNERLSHGLKWLISLKKNINKAKNSKEFQKAVSYKKWHAVKLIPSVAEGYAISASIEVYLKSNIKLSKLSKSPGSRLTENHLNKLENVKFNNQEAKNIFSELLDLNENSDFEIAEKRRIKAYERLNLSDKILNSLLV